MFFINHFHLKASLKAIKSEANANLLWITCQSTGIYSRQALHKCETRKIMDNQSLIPLTVHISQLHQAVPQVASHDKLLPHIF